MESKEKVPVSGTPPHAREPAWRPEVLKGATAADRPTDFDLAEIWYWFHARLEWLGVLNADQAHLTALLHWRQQSITIALQAARIEAARFSGSDDGRKAFLEYRAADCLARLALELDTLPDLELRPA